MNKPLSWRFLIPMCFSVSAMVAGFLSFVMAAQGDYHMSALFIMLSMIMDGFDGNIARLLRGTSDFGGEFDTYVDIMSFGVAPALLAYLYALHYYPIMGLVLASTMLLSGMIRLSRFRLVDPERGMKGYTGMPITVNAAYVALMVYLSEKSGGIFNLEMGWSAVLVWSVSMALVILQVSPFRYPKPTKHWFFIIPAAVMIMLLFVNDLKISISAAVGISLYGVFYAFLSPFLPRQAMADIDIEEEDDDDDPVEAQL
jgi:CDP-diacylglycerol--serine O-phosphatidyltransferase